MSVGIVLWGVKLIFYVQDIATARQFKCVIKGKVLDTDFNIKNRKERSPVVAGDIVDYEPTFTPSDTNTIGEGVILSRHERKNEIKRLKNNGRDVQTLTANIDRLFIIDSIYNPPLRTFFIDRMIFSADVMNIPVTIVINKIDLLDEHVKEFYHHVKEVYTNLGIDIIETSAASGIGLDTLNEKIGSQVVSFNGHSGVGKSSLIKACQPQHDSIKVGDISRKYDRGTHTTTFAQLYPTSQGGFITDTPGIREFSVFVDSPELVEWHFRDFDGFRDECHYPNCQHLDEPDCAVIAAVERGDIEPFRYESYLRMRETIEKLKDSKI